MATPPDFSVGQVLTAAHMDAVGLWLVKTQTIGTAVASETVTDAFSADFDCYRVIVQGGSASATNSLRMTLGATNSGYYQGGYGSTYAGTTNVANVDNGAFFAVGNGSTSTLFASIDVFDPFSTNETTVSGFAMSASTTGAMFSFAGYVNNTTSYTAFTLTASTGTLTGGTIRVYGYRN